ncbi:MAG: hypothetical protein A2W25_15180 [candidate division Zixibacteria bacterium RBG_16_53_22]|nr:MAG: hypothetical protein A2W25_15180 [candidate division Zixibacteria bacterium RBG_16_53_22]
MATVTIILITESDIHLHLECNFVNTSPAITWSETITINRTRLDGMTQAQIRDEVFFPLCQKLITERVGLRRAQLAANSIINVAQTVPDTN